MINVDLNTSYNNSIRAEETQRMANESYYSPANPLNKKMKNQARQIMTDMLVNHTDNEVLNGFEKRVFTDIISNTYGYDRDLVESDLPNFIERYTGVKVANNFIKELGEQSSIWADNKKLSYYQFLMNSLNPESDSYKKYEELSNNIMVDMSLKQKKFKKFNKTAVSILDSAPTAMQMLEQLGLVVGGALITGGVANALGASRVLTQGAGGMFLKNGLALGKNTMGTMLATKSAINGASALTGAYLGQQANLLHMSIIEAGGKSYELRQMKNSDGSPMFNNNQIAISSSLYGAGIYFIEKSLDDILNPVIRNLGLSDISDKVAELFDKNFATRIGGYALSQLGETGQEMLESAFSSIVDDITEDVVSVIGKNNISDTDRNRFNTELKNAWTEAKDTFSSFKDFFIGGIPSAIISQFAGPQLMYKNPYTKSAKNQVDANKFFKGNGVVTDISNIDTMGATWTKEMEEKILSGEKRDGIKILGNNDGTTLLPVSEEDRTYVATLREMGASSGVLVKSASNSDVFSNKVNMLDFVDRLSSSGIDGYSGTSQDTIYFDSQEDLDKAVEYFNSIKNTGDELLETSNGISIHGISNEAEYSFNLKVANESIDYEFRNIDSYIRSTLSDNEVFNTIKKLEPNMTNRQAYISSESVRFLSKETGLSANQIINNKNGILQFRLASDKELRNKLNSNINAVKAYAEENNLDINEITAGGWTEKQNRQFVINLTKSATERTIVHEVGHVMRALATTEQLRGFEGLNGIAGTVGSMWADDIKRVNGQYEIAGQTFKTYKEAYDTVARPNEEKFVDYFLSYIQNGVAPNQQVKSIFDKIRNFMKWINQTLSDEDISAEAKKAFDTLFNTEGSTEIRSGSFLNFEFQQHDQSIQDRINDDYQTTYDTLRANPKNWNGKNWLAPNGEISNLTERQYIQVRTPAFKEWFGDWENDPANASKIVDENGEPLVVYHGTMEEFDVFDASKSRPSMDIQGNFFSQWELDAKGYGTNVRAFFLNIKNPASESEGYSELNKYKGQYGAGIKAREDLIAKGFDGVNRENEEFIAFNPNQIKSATDNDGAFSRDNDSILFEMGEMREKQTNSMNFKRWFGNWNYDNNKNVEVLKLDTNILPFDYTNTKEIDKWLKDNLVGKTITNIDSNEQIGFNNRSSSASLKRRGLEQRGAYSILDSLIENAVYYDFERVDDSPKHRHLYGQDVYYSALNIGGKYYSVKIKTDIYNADKSSVYKDHNVKEIKTTPILYRGNRSTHAEGAVYISIGSITDNVKPSSSKVVNPDGTPKVVYHGTDKKFDTFSFEKSAMPIFWFTDNKQTIEEGTIGASGKGIIMEEYLDIKNPAGWEEYDKYGIQELIDKGYDGVILEDGDTTNYIVFNKNQIKSATNNNGDFSINRDSTLFELGEDYNPREFIPKVRGGWTKDKILKYLKTWATVSGTTKVAKLISEFDSPEEFKSHMFYHGTIAGSDRLRPSITMSDRTIERIGGGGYGEKYWAISLTKSKKIATNFSGPNDHVWVYPVVLAKNANVITLDIEDSAELEDHIVELYEQGVDAVWVGENGGGEQELAVINPRAIGVINGADYYKAYKLGSEDNPIRIKNDTEIAEIYNNAKEIVANPASNLWYRGDKEAYYQLREEQRRSILFELQNKSEIDSQATGKLDIDKVVKKAPEKMISGAKTGMFARFKKGNNLYITSGRYLVSINPYDKPVENYLERPKKDIRIGVEMPNVAIALKNEADRLNYTIDTKTFKELFKNNANIFLNQSRLNLVSLMGKEESKYDALGNKKSFIDVLDDSLPTYVGIKYINNQKTDDATFITSAVTLYQTDGTNSVEVLMMGMINKVSDVPYGDSQAQLIENGYGIDISNLLTPITQETQNISIELKARENSELETQKKDTIEEYSEDIKKAVENKEYIDRKYLNYFRGQKWADDEILVQDFLLQNPNILDEIAKYRFDEDGNPVDLTFDEWLTKSKTQVSDEDTLNMYKRIFELSNKMTPQQADRSFAQEWTRTPEKTKELVKLLRNNKKMSRGTTRFGAIKGMSLDVLKITDNSTFDEIQKASIEIQNNPRVYREAIQRAYDDQTFSTNGQYSNLNTILNEQFADIEVKNSSEDTGVSLDMASIDETINRADSDIAEAGVGDNKTEINQKLKETTEELKSARAELDKAMEVMAYAVEKGIEKSQAQQDEINKLNEKVQKLSEDEKKYRKAYNALSRKIEATKEKEQKIKTINSIKAMATFNPLSTDVSYKDMFDWVLNLFTMPEERRELLKEHDAVINQMKTVDPDTDEYQRLDNKRQKLNAQIRMSSQVPVIGDIRIYFGDKLTQKLENRMSKWTQEELNDLSQRVAMMRQEAQIKYQQKIALQMERRLGIARKTVEEATNSQIPYDTQVGTTRKDIVDFVNTMNRRDDADKSFDKVLDFGTLALAKQSRIARTISDTFYDFTVRQVFRHSSEQKRMELQRTENFKNKAVELGINPVELGKEGYTYTRVGTDSKKTLTRGQMLGVYVYSRSGEYGMPKLISAGGNGISQSDIVKIIDNLSANERAFGDFLIEEMSSRYSEMSRVYELLYNNSLGKRNFYFPLMALHQGVEDADGVDFLCAVNIKNGYVDKGMTKEANPQAVYELDLDVFNGWRKQMSRQEHFINFAEWARDAQYIMNKAGVSKMIGNKFGGKTRTIVDDYINYIGRPTYRGDELSNMVCNIVTRLMAGKVIGNISTAIKQVGSMGASVIDSDIKSVKTALFGDKTDILNFFRAYQILSEEGAVYDSWQDFMFSLDPSLKERRFDADMDRFFDLVENGNAFDRATGKIAEKLSLPMQIMDNFGVQLVWTSTFLHQYESLMAERSKTGMSIDEVVKEAGFRASQEVAETQNTTEKMDTNFLMRRASEGNALWKLVGAFQSQAMNMANQVYWDIPYSKRKGDYRRVLKIAGSLAFNTIVMMLIGGAFFKRDDEDDEEQIKRLFGTLLDETLGYFAPILGEDLLQTARGYSNENLIAGLTQELYAPIKDTLNGKEFSKVLEDLMIAFGDVSGTGSAYIPKLFNMVENDWNLGYLVNSTWGHIVEENR